MTADYDGGHSESGQNELPVETQDGQKVISKAVPTRDGFEFKGRKDNRIRTGRQRSS